METAIMDFDRLAELCGKAIAERYEEYERPSASARLQQELAIVQRLGRAKDFLLASQILQFAHREGIAAAMTGAACGSIISYLLGTSNIEPIRNGLLFERFLDPEGRWSMPFVMEVEAAYKTQVEDCARHQFPGQILDRFQFQDADFVLFLLHRIVRRIRQGGDSGFALGDVPLDNADTFRVFAGTDCFHEFPFLDEEVMYILPFCQPSSIAEIACICVDVVVGNNTYQFEEDERTLSSAHPEVLMVLNYAESRICFQEQIMSILNRLSGMSVSDAYGFVKAATERDWTAVDCYRKKFLAGADKLEKDVALGVINWLEDATQFARCKADEICQAVRIYQSAYLQVHYPTAFNQVVQSLGYCGRKKIDGKEAERDA